MLISAAALTAAAPSPAEPLQITQQHWIQVHAMLPTGQGLDRNPGGLQPGPDGVPGGVVLPGDLVQAAALGVPTVKIRRHRRRRVWMWWCRPPDAEFSSSPREPIAAGTGSPAGRSLKKHRQPLSELDRTNADRAVSERLDVPARSSGERHEISCLSNTQLACGPERANRRCPARWGNHNEHREDDPGKSSMESAGWRGLRCAGSSVPCRADQPGRGFEHHALSGPMVRERLPQGTENLVLPLAIEPGKESDEVR